MKTPDRKLACLIRYLGHLRDTVPASYQYTHQKWIEHFESQIVTFTQQFGVNKKG